MKTGQFPKLGSCIQSEATAGQNDQVLTQDKPGRNTTQGTNHHRYERNWRNEHNIEKLWRYVAILK